MSRQNWTTDIERLSVAVNNLQKCLDCTICLELMKAPVKTRCGHSFCQSCIGEVLRKKNACCPLCKKSLNRRSISKDDHMEACIHKFNKLVLAIQMDSYVDILSYSKQPRDTKESCSNSSESQSNCSNKRKPPKKQSARAGQSQRNTSKADKSTSANRKKTAIDYGHSSRYVSSKISEQKSIVTLSSLSNVGTSNENACDTANFKVRTWLHCHPDEINTTLVENETQLDQDEIKPINLISDDYDSESDATGNIKDTTRDKVVASSSTTTRVTKRIVDRVKRDSVEDDTSQASKDMTTKRSGKTKKIDSTASGLKYSAIHGKVRAKDQKKSVDARMTDGERRNNQDGSSSANIANQDQARQIDSPTDNAVFESQAELKNVDRLRDSHGRLLRKSSTVTDKQSAANATWSRVIEFGKEMCPRKKKRKKLNVSMEKNKKPTIVEDVILTPNKQYSRSTLNRNTNDREADVSNLLRESSCRKQEQAIDKSLDSSNITPSKVSTTSETKDRGRQESFIEDKTEDNFKSDADYHAYITEEGKILIKNLNSRQVNDIISLEDVGGDSPSAADRANVPGATSREGDAEIITEYRDSPRKRLIVLTPRELNESIGENESTHDNERTRVLDNFDRRGSSSGLSDENRTPGTSANNNSVRRETSGGIAAQLRSPTPNKSRLSLKRNSAGRNIDSPLSSDLLLNDKLSSQSHDAKKGKDNRRSVDTSISKDGPSLERLAAVRRDLSSQIIGEDRLQTAGPNATAADTFSETTVKVKDNDNVEIVCEMLAVGSTSKKFKSQSKKSQTHGNHGGFPIKFMQMGTLVRRQNIKYLCMGKTKRERSLPAEVLDSTVCNMQQSISRYEAKRNYIGSESRNLATSSNPASDSQDSANITVTEDVRLANSSIARTGEDVLEDTRFSTVYPSCDIPASSTPKKGNADRRSSREDTAMIEGSPTNAGRTNGSNRSIRCIERGARLPHEISGTDGGAIRRNILDVHSRRVNDIKLLSPDKDSQLKFLTIDSPSQREESRLASSTRQQRRESRKSVTKENNFPVVKSPLCVAMSASEAHSVSESSESSEFPPHFRPGKKRKRMRCTGDKEPSRNGSSSSHRDDDDSSDSSGDNNSERTIQLDKYRRKSKTSNNAKSDTDVNKKRRLSSPHDENAEVARSNSKEQQDAHGRKLKRIISTSSSDTESEATYVARNSKRNKTDDQCDQRNVSITSTSHKGKERSLLRQDSDENLRIRNIVEKWSNEYNETQKKLMREGRNIQESVKSMKCTSEEKTAGHRSFLSTDVPETERRKNTKSSQKDFATIDSDLFDSNSVFNSANPVQIATRQSTNSDKSKASQKESVDPFNDDIINRVLQIERLQNNPNAPQSTDSAPRNDETNQRDKEHNLLQDIYDEIIANVDLPQSEDVIPCTELPNRDLNRTLTQHNASRCPTVTNELRDVTQETPKMIPASSTNDIFEHCSYSSRNIRELPVRSAVSRNSDKENIVSCSRKKHDCAEGRRDKINVTTRNLADVVDTDSRRKITSRNNRSQEKEGLLEGVDTNERLQIDKEINISTKSIDQLHVDDDRTRGGAAVDKESNLKDDSLEYDTLMDVTQQQVQLQKLEEDLFGVEITRNRTNTVTMTLQNEFPFREEQEQRTPKKKNPSARTKNATSEEPLAEEDDVVENTPETKTKNGNSVKTTKSSTRRNIAISYLSPIPKIAGPLLNISSCKKTISKSGANTPVSRSGIYPLYQSTPKVASTNRPDASTESKRLERAMASGGVSFAKHQAKSKTSEDEGQRGERSPADKPKLCFVCSGLSATQITSVKEFAQRCDANYLTQFDRSVTHVIVSTTGEENVAKNTLKYLQGIVHRKWIVGYKWVENSIRERKLLDETPYEATTSGGNVNRAGPRNSRLRDNDLFEDFTFLCIGPYDNVSLSQYQDLLLATGATVVDSLEALAAEGKGFKGVVIQDGAHDNKEIEYWYHTARAAPISIDWIVYCIGQYKLASLAPYFQNLSSEDYSAIGYPCELLEDDECSDMST